MKITITIMRLSAIVKEKVARVIGSQFTTSGIAAIFEAANIPANVSLFAKWRITLDAFNQITSEEAFSKILADFCHPLNFAEKEVQKGFVDALNEVLAYENIKIITVGNKIDVIVDDGGRKSPLSEVGSSDTKTSTDYIIEAINFFKDEYNKVRMEGFSYEYPLGENIKSEQVDNGKEGYSEKLQAIEQLKNVGFVTNYEVVERIENEGYYIWDYAICKIDESKITQKKAPSATDAGVKEVVQKVVHEHTHRFENSIQEKAIDLNIKAQDKKDDKPKFPHKLPAGTQWENFTLKFVDDENLLIVVRQFSYQASYQEMGFLGRGKNPRPSEAWAFLKVLAMINGEITIKDPEAKDKYKKQKQLLSDTLKAYFSLDSDPFQPYEHFSPAKSKQVSSYQIRATLIPPPKEDGNEKAPEPTEDTQDNDLGVMEFLAEEAPQVPE